MLRHNLFPVFLLTIVSINAQAFNTSGVCDQVGKYIANQQNAAAWVRYNDPSADSRLEFFESKQSIQAMQEQLKAFVINSKLIESFKDSKTYFQTNLRGSIYSAASPIQALPIKHLCKQISEQPEQCTDLAMKALKLANHKYFQKGDTAFSVVMPDRFEKLFTDQKQLKVIKQLGLEQLEIITRYKAGIETREYHFYEHLSKVVGVVTQLPLKHSVSQELLMNTLLLYGSHGAGLEFVSEIFDHVGLQTALRVFSHSVSVIDGFQFQKFKSQYSLPAMISTECLQGKPYHFWMAFTLASLLEEGSEQVKSESVFILGLLYEYFGQSNGRIDSEKKILTSPVNSMFNSSARITSAFKWFGAKMGANTSHTFNGPYKVDQLISQAFRSSKEVQNKSTSYLYPHSLIDRLSTKLGIVEAVTSTTKF